MPNEKIYMKETKSGVFSLEPCAAPGDSVTWVNLTDEECTVTFSPKSPFAAATISVPAPPPGGFQGQSTPVQVNRTASGTYKYTCTSAGLTVTGKLSISPASGTAESEKICISEASNQLQLNLCAAAADTVTWVNKTSEDYTMANFNPPSPQLFPVTSIDVPANGSNSSQVEDSVVLGTAYAYTCSPAATGGQIIIVDSTKPIAIKTQNQEDAELVGAVGSRR
jgi:plastocyanin